MAVPSTASNKSKPNKIIDFIRAARECVAAVGDGLNSPACSTLSTYTAVTELAVAGAIAMGSADAFGSIAPSFAVAGLATVGVAVVGACLREGAAPAPEDAARPAQMNAYVLGAVTPVITGVATAVITKLAL